MLSRENLTQFIEDYDGLEKVWAWELEIYELRMHPTYFKFVIINKVSARTESLETCLVQRPEQSVRWILTNSQRKLRNRVFRFEKQAIKLRSFYYSNNVEVEHLCVNTKITTNRCKYSKKHGIFKVIFVLTSEIEVNAAENFFKYSKFSSFPKRFEVRYNSEQLLNFNNVCLTKLML